MIFVSKLTNIMKNFVVLQVFCIFTTSLLNAQKVGINKISPAYPVDIVQPVGITLWDLEPVLNVQYTGTNPGDAVAIKGTCQPSDGRGIGGYFKGGSTGAEFHGGYAGIFAGGHGFDNSASYGVLTQVLNNGAVNSTLSAIYGHAIGGLINYGSRLLAEGSSSTNYGVHATANGWEGINYGVYATATGGSQNWAGYFDYGNVHIHQNLGIGQLNPTVDVDILSPQAVAKLTSSNSVNGSVLSLQNSSVAPAYLGAINFGDGNSAPGQIGYLADHHFTIRVNNTERFRINSSGLVGIGRTPTTNKLEVEGAASKSSSGDWLANSDARLKKNIQPLDEKDMIEKLLALKGVTYEWNDDKTGTERPDGIQYGFTAQNIQEVFPPHSSKKMPRDICRLRMELMMR